VKCREVKRLIGLWSAGGDVSSHDARDLEDHVSSCPDCGPAYGDVIPFILRDACQVSTVEAAVSVPPPVRAREKPRAWFPALVITGLVLTAVGVGVASWWATRSQRTQVLFSLDAPDARSVSLVGDFNAWDRAGIPMLDKDGDGTWTVKVLLQRGRSYRSNFLLDEERLIADPASTLRVPDGFGGESSVLRVE